MVSTDMMSGNGAARKRLYPFNAEQTVNILGEFGPLVIMFLVNAVAGVAIGTWALIISTGLALAMTLIVLGRPPVFPFIAGAVTIGFGIMTLTTGDPMWIQIKVTIFNLLFAVVLWVGMAMGRNFFKFVFGKTFHYTEEGWRKFTHAFAAFFVFTALANEAVRLGFQGVDIEVLGKSFDGVQIWIFFKLIVIMPLAGLFGWWQTRRLARYKLQGPTAPLAAGPEPGPAFVPSVQSTDAHRSSLTGVAAILARHPGAQKSVDVGRLPPIGRAALRPSTRIIPSA